MRAGRIPPALGLAWLEQAGRALDAAHAAGVIHRDVKPANLMLGADGEVRVTDFGIARIAGDASLTSVGTILGTSGYMSPEQAVGGTATAASDRYGLAVVAFELLCGRRPYLAETFAAEAAAHATAPIPAATSFDRSLPPSIDMVLERSLAKDPAERYRSCGELVANLKSAFADSAGTTVRMVGAPPPPAATVVAPPRSRHASRRSGRTVGIAAALGALALLGIVLAAVVGRDDGSLPATTVVRTATVAGEPQVRTVTVEAQPATASGREHGRASGHRPGGREWIRPQRPGVQAAQGRRRGRRAADSRACRRRTPGLRLPDGGLRLVQPRRSPGSPPATATASRSCSTAPRRIQGDRSEIKRLRHDADKGCEQ